MPSHPSQFPDLQLLQEVLTSLLTRQGKGSAPLTIRERRPEVNGSFPHEVVTCCFAGGGTLQLFCKYGIGRTVSGCGHRGGVAYEAEMYRSLLQTLPLPVPALFGDYRHPATGDTWLFLEYLNGSIRVNGAEDLDVLCRAARWIGQFHAACQVSPASTPLPRLNTYDAEYYLNWSHRTGEFAAHLQELYPWLATLCREYEHQISLLLAGPLTVIHGEYYPRNILYCRENIYPVDWESAAVAAGEIDLASLTENWPEGLQRRWERAYCQARWPESPSPLFSRRLDVARLYLHFRWLGDRPEWTVHQKASWRFHQLQSIGQRLGLL
jgi:hypothetical protein